MRKKACDAEFSAGEGQSDTARHSQAFCQLAHDNQALSPSHSQHALVLYSEFGLGMVTTFRRLVLLGFGRVGNVLVIRHVIRKMKWA